MAIPAGDVMFLDTIVVATVQEHEIALLATRNSKDFARYPEIEMVRFSEVERQASSAGEQP